MKILKQDEVVAEGEQSTQFPNSFYFESSSASCIDDLVSNAENVTVGLDEDFFDHNFPKGLPRSLQVTLSKDQFVSMNDFPLSPETEDWKYEIVNAVREALSWALREIRSAGKTDGIGVHVSFSKKMSPKDRSFAGRNGENPPVYKVGE